jgi:hypothetical protein
MDTNTVLTVVGVGLVFWAMWHDKRNAKKAEKRHEEWRRSQLSDVAVAKEQSKFEERMVEGQESGIPDAIIHKRAYIYWNLMRGWFEAILAKNYGNEVVCNQIKINLLRYIELLRDHEMHRFLAVEEEDEAKATERWKDAFNDLEEIGSIETALASAIGNEASEILASVRLLSLESFDRTGRKPIAPIGFKYSFYSPYELVPDKK